MRDNSHEPDEHRQEDPLGLRALPQLEPEADGWPAVRAALGEDPVRDERPGPGPRAPLAWLAAAACLVLVVGVLVNQEAPGPDSGAATPVETQLADAGPAPDAEAGALSSASPPAASVEDLIVLSQLLERRLRGLRARTGSLPAESAVYVAELEDLITRVDGALSDTPGSPELWGQRINLLLDLEALFQHQFEKEYGRMASL